MNLQIECCYTVTAPVQRLIISQDFQKKHKISFAARILQELWIVMSLNEKLFEENII